MSDTMQPQQDNKIDLEVHAARFLRHVYQSQRDYDLEIRQLTLERDDARRDAQMNFRYLDRATRRAHDLYQKIAPLIGQDAPIAGLYELDTFFSAVEELMAKVQVAATDGEPK